MPADFLPVSVSEVKFIRDKKLLRKFRIMLVGAADSGKSFIFSQMLFQKGSIDYNKLYYYSRTYESQQTACRTLTDLWKPMNHVMYDVSKHQRFHRKSLSASLYYTTYGCIFMHTMIFLI